MEFTKRLQALNTAQREAVDAIDGPVMVVAGPGTGKTELLSVRVANILDKTDTLPSNILCLTFTDSAATTMRERLASLIGPEAYKVAIHTFHSFGSEIINTKSEYFYHGAHFRPADELSSYEILTEILEKLPHGNAVASTMNGTFTHIGDLQHAIADLKKSGLTPDEFGRILDRNDAFIEWLQPRLQPLFEQRISKKLYAGIDNLVNEINKYDDEPLELVGYRPLAQTIHDSLRAALSEAETRGTTTPISTWKKCYLEKNAHDAPVLRDAKRSIKLRTVTQIYYDYLVAMQERELYDYDDMILRVVHAMEVFAELRFDLQETYQYILVDEFQDTNDAQMRLIWNLTNNTIQNGRPNLMVVGDDDQAIYRFQGATVSNIIDFTSRYRDVKVITLTDNYRSSQGILELARSVIVQGQERLETTLSIDKTLLAHHAPDKASLARHQYETEHEARSSLARQVAADFRTNASARFAVIARNHRQLMALVPHLQANDLPLRYERQENILDSEPVQQLELVARIVMGIATQQFDDVNALLPELLAHPAWGIPAQDIWRLSVDAHHNRRYWLEEMLQRTDNLCDIAEWLIVASQYSLSEPLEFMCDHLFGVEDEQTADTPNDEAEPALRLHHEDFSSPYRAYFFPSDSLQTHPGRYLAWLSCLQKLRSSLREFRPGRILTLADMIEFIDLHHTMDLSIQGKGTVEYDVNAITLLSAHKSKGLEFDAVYVTDAVESIWGSSARARPRLVQFPSNVPIAPAGDSDDERLRLLYVALTRAKNSLQLYSARQNDAGKTLLPIGTIANSILPLQIHEPLPHHELIAATENDWRRPLHDVTVATQKQLLRPLLDHYMLSATHLNNFLNVPRGGPELFLLHNLLRFPQAMGVGAAYGSAIHASLQRAHAHLAATGKKRPVEDVLHDFEEALRQLQVSDTDLTKQLQRGSMALSQFLATRYDSFSPHQLAERSFATESIHIGDVMITGSIDLIDIDTDEKTIFITDYKTGKSARTWQGRTDYERIKLHHYEQQLMLYKLLVENSRQFRDYTVTGARIEFVEPDEKGDIILLNYSYDLAKMTEFNRLINAVWQRIQSLEFHMPTEYSLDFKGILEFEQDLLAT